MSFSNVKLMNSLCFEAELSYRLHIVMIVVFLNLFACLIHLVIYQKVAYQILKYILGLFKTVIYTSYKFLPVKFQICI